MDKNTDKPSAVAFLPNRDDYRGTEEMILMHFKSENNILIMDPQFWPLINRKLKTNRR